MRFIHVLRNYGGSKTGEQRIAAGDYSDDDPRLFGLADYLIENGHAVQVGGASDTAELEPAPSDERQAVSEALAEESAQGVSISKRRRNG